MPRKSKKKSSLQDISVPPSRRGRPRKFIAPETLIPFGEHEVASVKKFERQEKQLKPRETNPTNRHTNPATSERYYSLDEVEFMNALEEFKRASGRLFPTCSEILGVLRSLGYEKTNREEAQNTEVGFVKA